LDGVRHVDLRPLLLLDQLCRTGEAEGVISNEEGAGLANQMETDNEGEQLTCDAVTPRRDTIILLDSVSVAMTNSQFSLKISTNSVSWSPACCSDRTAKILEARRLASSHAEATISETSMARGVGPSVGLFADSSSKEILRGGVDLQKRLESFQSTGRRTQ
jgi:hypothetical protein